MDVALVAQVWQRANDLCEYCRMPQELDATPFEIDHIIARKHGGPTVAANLALSCCFCNSHKGSDIAGLDSRTGKLMPLFNPRRHKCSRHFRWRGAFLLGRTPIGRVTVALLNINDLLRVALRESLIDEGIFPPQ
jgi:hypothetical protein